MSATAKVPAGMSMMLKALGIEFDPSVIPQVAGAVKEIADRLARIEKQQLAILAALGKAPNGQSIL